jgi:hypothetical protein
MHPLNEMTSRFPETIGTVVIAQRVDSTQRRINDFYCRYCCGQTWWLDESAYKGDFAIVANGRLITGFIFEGGMQFSQYWALARYGGRYGILDLRATAANLAATAAPTPADTPAQQPSPTGHTNLRLQIDSTTYTLNGQSRQMEAAPFLAQGRTMIPIRVVAEALGADVGWDGATRTVTIRQGAADLSLVLDSPLPGGMGTPVSVGGRTFVPLAFVAEQLGASVSWDEATRTVIITTG